MDQSFQPNVLGYALFAVGVGEIVNQSPCFAAQGTVIVHAPLIEDFFS